MESATLAGRLEPTAILALWEEKWKEQPHRFPSDIAAEIGVPEAALLAARASGRESTKDNAVIALRPDWDGILSSLRDLGPVKTVTRNEWGVIEKNGSYPKFQSFGVHAMFVGNEIDLRITIGAWASAFAVTAPGRREDTLSHSVQFFGTDGAAVHKLFLRAESSTEAFHRIAREFAGAADLEAAARPSPTPEGTTLSRAEVDKEALLDGWSKLQDTHEFFSLLHRHKVTRTDALALAEGQYTRRLDPSSLRLLLHRLSSESIPVMVFLGNPGCIQIHKGPLKKIVDWKGWLNVMDPEVELHIREDAIAEVWAVKKPAKDRVIASLEVFDAKGRDILSVFGVRKEGKAQEDRWREALKSLPSTGGNA